MHGDLVTELEGLLRQILAGRDLADTTDSEIGEDSTTGGSASRSGPSTQAGIVTASILLARKRPHLIPLQGGVLESACDWKHLYWASLRREVNAGLKDVLRETRAAAGFDDAASLLRIFGVSLWVTHVAGVTPTEEPENEVSDD